jgi:hypothetical protein
LLASLNKLQGDCQHFERSPNPFSHNVFLPVAYKGHCRPNQQVAKISGEVAEFGSVGCQAHGPSVLHMNDKSRCFARTASALLKTIFFLFSFFFFFFFFFFLLVSKESFVPIVSVSGPSSDWVKSSFVARSRCVLV